jgi:glycopeptide antibiotics resistance protein
LIESMRISGTDMMRASRSTTTITAKPSRSRERARRDDVSWYVRAGRGLVVLLALTALCVFGYWAYRFTLVPVPDPHGWAVGNSQPGHTLRFYLDRPSVKEAALQIGGNLALLAPLGVLLPLMSTRLRGLVRLTVITALVSLAIETTQGTLIAGRAFDVDDIILNTAGVALAYLVLGRRISLFIRGRTAR